MAELGHEDMKWLDECTDDSLPEDLDSFDLFQIDPCVVGTIIGWWYEEDVEYANENDISLDDLRNDPPYFGVIVPSPGQEVRGEFFDAEDAVVIVVGYRAEKTYCMADYVAFRRLLNDKTLAAIVEMGK